MTQPLQSPFFFISYAHDDHAFVKRIVDGLKNYGIRVWIDSEGLIPGTPDWEEELRRVIPLAQAVLFMASPKARSSPFVKDELAIAQHYKHRVVPIWVTGEAWIDCIPMGLGHTQYIDARETRYETALMQLVYTLNNIFAQTTVKRASENKEPDDLEKFHPSTKEQWLNEGNRYHRAKLYEKALEAYERALQLDSNYARAQRNKADALYDLKRYPEALDAYTIAVRLDPTSARAHRNMADILAHLGRHNEALDAYKRAIQITPTAKLYNEEGDVLFRLNHYKDALQAYEQAVQLDLNFVYAWNNKGNALSRLKRYQEAIVAYERASQLDPTFVLPYNNKGRALFYLERYRESLIAYEQALRIDPNFAAVYSNYAETLEKLNMTQEAAAARAKAQELKNRKALTQA